MSKSIVGLDEWFTSSTDSFREALDVVRSQAEGALCDAAPSPTSLRASSTLIGQKLKVLELLADDFMSLARLGAPADAL